MREIPILFSAPMMRANLAGTKDVTRRVVKPQPYYRVRTNGRGVWFWERSKSDLREYINWDGQTCEELMRAGMPEFCRYGKPGDVLWAKETWRPFWHPELYCCVQYASDSSYRKPEFTNEERGHRFADMCEQSGDNAEPWHPSIHMWREMARFTAPVVSVRIERLQEITEEDCAREGIATHFNGHAISGLRHEYAALWDSINGEGSWAANPWVWRIEYRNPHKEYA